ncbi:zinc finger protein 208 [Elysia marginata]|uniref:Zinc finger protein 208 n=1 Tax=Elysia marginata TaxID=1093978 RepID=A0AAV4JGZ0_9GAST|nr:zinc finger protein 208 [Elysia marginata]
MDPNITMMSEEEATEVGPNDIVIHLVNPYKCGICELEFLEKSVFKEHMFSHLEQIKQERPSSQIVMTVVLPPETPGGVTVTRDILQLGEDGSIKQVPQPPNNITLNQVQPLRELEEAGVIKLEKPKPTVSLLPSEGLNETMSIMSDAQAIVPQDLVPAANPAPPSLVPGSAVSLAPGSGMAGQGLLKDALVKNTGEQNGEALEIANPALIPNKDGTFSFAFKGSNEEMQHIQIIRSDGIKTEVLMELGTEKQDMVQPVRAMRVPGRLSGANKNNECDICGKILSSSTNLLRHKMYHSAERPFVCQVCNKGFKDISNLKKHTLIHKRIFPCHLCKKSFLRKSQLDIHLRRHESRTTFVKTGNTSKEVTMRTFIDVDGSRVEEMSMTALGGQTFEYKNRIEKAEPASSLEAKGCMDISKDPINSILDSSASAESTLQTEQDGISEGKPNQVEGDKRMDKLFTVTMEGLQETNLPINQMNGEQPLPTPGLENAESDDLAPETKFPPPPDEFVKVYQCGHCGKRTVQRGNMMRHLIHHLKDRPFACDECPKRFVDKGELFKHKKTHTKPYRCPNCSGAFAHNVQLVKHLQKECLGNLENLNYTVMEDGQTYKCDICGVEMKRLGNMIKHVGTHRIGASGSTWSIAGGKRKAMPAPKPSPGKPNAPYFYDSKRRAFFCGFCPKSFWKKANVLRCVELHMKKGDQQDNRKSFKCDLCPKAFSRKIFLDAHKRIRNCSEMPVETPDYAPLKDKSGYYCKHCNITLPQKYRMMSHVKKHISGRPFECLTCNKCFGTVHLLVKHKRVHKKPQASIRLKRNHSQQPRFDPGTAPPFPTKVEPEEESEKFPCSYCGAPFARMVIKLNHEKKCREESKVVERLPDGAGFKCKICGKTATLKHNLMVHVRKHDSVKIIDTAGLIVVGDGSEPASSPQATKRVGMSSTNSAKKRKLSVSGSESVHSKDDFILHDDSFEEEADLEDNEDHRFKRTPGGYACVKCRRKFTDKDTLSRHLESHENEEAGNVPNGEENGNIFKLELTKSDIDLLEAHHEATQSQPKDITNGSHMNGSIEDTGENPVPSVFSEGEKQTASVEVKSKPKLAVKKHGSTPTFKKAQQDTTQRTPVVSIKRLDDIGLSAAVTPSITPPRSDGRPARAQKIPSRFLE